MKELKNRNEYSFLLKSVGLFFKKQRLDKNEKIYSVSMSLNITHPVISKIENGIYYSLSIKLIMKLLQHYNIGLEVLLMHLISAIEKDNEHFTVNGKNKILLSFMDIKNIIESVGQVTDVENDKK